jgi:hypothetical protein
MHDTGLSRLLPGVETELVGLGEPRARAEWAREHREWLWPDLRLDFEEHKYLEGLYQDEAAEIVVRKAAQMGLSEWAITDGFWAADARGANVLYLLPGTSDVQDFSTTRMGLAIEASPYIASIISPERGGSYRTISRDRTTLKRIRNRFFYLRHGSVRPDGRAPHLRTAQIDLLVFDELDELDRRAPAIADKRLGHSRLKWKRWISTPTLPDMGIDAKMKESDQRRWIVKCEHCNERQPLDPFVNLILETDAAGRPSKWFHTRGKPEQPFVGCRKCGKRMDRLAEGEWVPQFPEQAIHGYQINKLMSARVDLYNLIRKGQTYDETERQEWWNQDLGLPYQPSGSGFEESLLRSVEQPYRMPIADDRGYMGIDVGAVLHVVIRKWHASGNGRPTRRAVFIGEVETFAELDDLWERYDVRYAVIDALPEKHKAIEWAAPHSGLAKVAFYATGAAGTRYDEAAREKGHEDFTIEIDRTRYFDGLRADFLAQEVSNPADLQSQVPEYFKHYGRLTRVMVQSRDGSSYASWVKSGDDHFAHADLYCRAAMEMAGPPIEGDAAVMVGGDERPEKREATLREDWEQADQGDGRGKKSAWR